MCKVRFESYGVGRFVRVRVKVRVRYCFGRRRERLVVSISWGGCGRAKVRRGLIRV